MDHADYKPFKCHPGEIRQISTCSSPAYQVERAKAARQILREPSTSCEFGAKTAVKGRTDAENSIHPDRESLVHRYTGGPRTGTGGGEVEDRGHAAGGAVLLRLPWRRDEEG